MSRAVVSVYSGVDGKATGQARMPGVFEAPIRTDVVHHVHRDISKNRRHPYGVSKWAGHQTSAESWGTGRAVARIPRVPGGGTHRAGQGAFGNMCRGGRMFSPNKTYRRWHRKVNKNQRRYAVVSALAASSCSSLVMARGHKIENVPEIPLVIATESAQSISKTSAAVNMLKALNAYADVERVKDSKKLRAGKGKMRNRRYRQRRGPLVVYSEKSSLNYAIRNLPGVELCCVNSLNLLKLAPGGHLGRFVIWTKDALDRLNCLYGSYKTASTEKFGYKLPRPIMSNSDLSRLINSSEIQSVLKPKVQKKKYVPHKKNPLKNLGVMMKLNPYSKVLRRKELLRSSRRAKKVQALYFAKKTQAREIQKQKLAIKEAKKVKGATVPEFVPVKLQLPGKRKKVTKTEKKPSDDKTKTKAVKKVSSTQANRTLFAKQLLK